MAGNVLALGASGFIAGDLLWLVVYSVLSALIYAVNPGLGVFDLDPLGTMFSLPGLICGLIVGILCMVEAGSGC